ncbi:MAG TPA: EamA family transporter [Acetobacteraceae bacterium]|nr:EamA family transporter [Acetobacteraceae bacterium]
MLVISLWVPITFAASLFQTWRTALQQKLRSRFSVGTAGLVRYLYAIPVGAALLLIYVFVTGAALPRPNGGFLLGCVVGGLAQVFGTSLLIMAFGYRNFAVGTAYSKTDAVQAALVSWALWGEALAPLAWVGIAVGVCGVLVLSLAGRGLQPGTLLRATVQPAALCGIGAGAGFALAGIGIRGATRSLAIADPVLAALCALVVTNTLQTLMQGGWMAWRQPEGLRAAFSGWRSASWVGALSACGSACWFAAFALAPVALVRTLGQVEVVFTLLFSRFYLRETVRPADVLGLVLVVAGVALVLAVH